MSERNALLRLKAALRDLVAAAGGQVRAGEIAGVSHTTVHRWGSAADGDSFAPIHAVLRLEAETGAPLVTAALADLAGHVLVKKEAAEQPDEAIAMALGGVATETGEVITGLGRALADGTVDADEAAALLPEVRQAQTKLAELGQSLESKAAAAKPRLVR